MKGQSFQFPHRTAGSPPPKPWLTELSDRVFLFAEPTWTCALGSSPPTGPRPIPAASASRLRPKAPRCRGLVNSGSVSAVLFAFRLRLGWCFASVFRLRPWLSPPSSPGGAGLSPWLCCHPGTGLGPGNRAGQAGCDSSGAQPVPKRCNDRIAAGITILYQYVESYPQERCSRLSRPGTPAFPQAAASLPRPEPARSACGRGLSSACRRRPCPGRTGSGRPDALPAGGWSR